LNQIQAVLPDAVGVQQDDGENDKSTEGGVQLDERYESHEAQDSRRACAVGQRTLGDCCDIDRPL
jgi:hypothetical protein